MLPASRILRHCNNFNLSRKLISNVNTSIMTNFQRRLVSFYFADGIENQNVLERNGIHPFGEEDLFASGVLAEIPLDLSQDAEDESGRWDSSKCYERFR